MFDAWFLRLPQIVRREIEMFSNERFSFQCSGDRPRIFNSVNDVPHVLPHGTDLLQDMLSDRVQ